MTWRTFVGEDKCSEQLLLFCLLRQDLMEPNWASSWVAATGLDHLQVTSPLKLQAYIAMSSLNALTIGVLSLWQLQSLPGKMGKGGV